MLQLLLPLFIAPVAPGADLSAPARPAPSARPIGWSYSTRIAPILTSAGCNSGSCHGGPVGKGGFRLSLFNNDPERDYQTIARDGGGRRVNRAEPGASLLLRKATLQIPHKGGRRFTADSREARLLAGWIAAGTPWGEPAEPKLTGLEVLPRGRVLTRPGERQRLRVLARYSDGRSEDVSGWCVFSSGDDSVAQVDAQGVVTASGQGEAPILVRYAGLITAAVVGATNGPPVADFPKIAAENPVDRYVYAKLRALRLRPAAPCSDAEFLRRASLDLTATLPTAEEARAFLAECRAESANGHPALESRRMLVERLLARPEYGDYQALLWAERLRSNSRFHRIGGVRAYQKWLKESFAANMPLDEFARKLLTSKGQNYSDGPSNYWGNYDKISTPEEIAPQTSQLFLGVRLHCAQCHNHPFEKWTQNDFYSLAAVFGHVKWRGTKQTQEFELFLDPKGTVENPATGQVMPARALNSPVFDPAGVEDMRTKFTDWLTAPDNPFFAKAMVNRIWRQLMGRGLVEPVDDLRATNPPTHPELLDALARELVAHRYDQKHVIRLIVNSRAYQASSDPARGSEKDTKYYSRFYPKRLMAEVYYDAVCQVTGRPDEFKNWPEAKRAVQLPDNRYALAFLDTFGRGNRLTICERDEEATLTQALNMINGSEVQEKVAAKEAALAKLLASGPSDEAVTEELFLATLSRPPRPEERRRLARQLVGVPREEAFQDLLWALLTCREFQFNH